MIYNKFIKLIKKKYRKKTRKYLKLEKKKKEILFSKTKSKHISN